jgi:hypothetical protein
MTVKVSLILSLNKFFLSGEKMTSSFKIKSRYENAPSYDFGPWYDHYIRPFGKCNSDFFDTVLIGNDPRGVKVCTRKPSSKRDKPDLGPFTYRYSRRLYEYDREPIQVFNSFPRVPPNEGYNVYNDYYKLEPFFNGTGVYKSRTCRDTTEFAY